MVELELVVVVAGAAPKVKAGFEEEDGVVEVAVSAGVAPKDISGAASLSVVGLAPKERVGLDELLPVVLVEDVPKENFGLASSLGLLLLLVAGGLATPNVNLGASVVVAVVAGDLATPKENLGASVDF